MADITAPTPNDTTGCAYDNSLRLRKFSVTTNAAATSTWPCGIDGIVKAAWKADASTDVCAVTFSGSTLTFTTDGSARSGTVFIWSAS